MSAEFRLGTLVIALLLSSLLPTAARAQDAGAPGPTVPPEDYGKWEVLVERPALSPDGRWLAYGIRRVDRERELRVRALDGDAEHVLPWGEAPKFSADSRWLVWTRGVSEKESEALTQADEPVRNGAGMLELATGEKTERDAISQLSFDESGRFLAMLGYPPEEPEHAGTTLVLLDLATDTPTSFGNVGEYDWSDTGSLLALAIATGDDSGNGVQVFDVSGGRLRSLDSSGSVYRGLAWREEGADLAFLRSMEPASQDGSAHALVAWRGLDGGDPEQWELLSEAAGSGDEEIVRHATPRWSDDERLVAFGLRPREESKKEDTSDAESDGTEEGAQEAPDATDEDDEAEKELPALQIWHSTDVRIYPEQKAAEDRDKERVLLALWHLDDGRVVRVGTDLAERSELLDGWNHAVERLASPYPWGTMFGRPYHDVWSVDTGSGERLQVMERERYTWASAGGRYLLSFDGDHYWSLDLTSGERANLTEDLGAVFGDQEYDTPTDRRPPYGVSGWLAEDDAVLLYSRFDVWRVAPDGSGGERITCGAVDEVVHRVLDLDPEEEAIATAEPIFFSLRAERTEQRGFARLEPGRSEVERLLLEDKRHWMLTKAEEAAVYVYRTEARDDSPDYFVAGPDLSSARRVTETNPFQDDYAWTRTELLDFESEAGIPLQAGLLYPAVHDPSQRYPMIVYTYEILAPQIHFYEAPDERDYYCVGSNHCGPREAVR